MSRLYNPRMDLNLGAFLTGALQGLFPPSLQGVQEVSTPYGSCLVLESVLPLPVIPPNEEGSVSRFLRHLGLVHGVGPVREAFLKERGYATLLDLAQHPRFGRDALRWGKAILEKELATLYQGLCHWYSPAHPLVLALWGLAFPERVVLLDLESLGLSTLPIFLVALGKIQWPEGVVRIKQFLARNLGEEMAVLAQCVAEIPRDPLVVSYNGKAHDWRQLRARLAYYGLGDLPNPAHLDLLFFVRRRWREELGDCSLAHVERRILGRTRPLDIPGEEVPLYYQAFLQSGNPRFLLPILAHNREDVTSLVVLLEKIQACYGGASQAA